MVYDGKFYFTASGEEVIHLQLGQTYTISYTVNVDIYPIPPNITYWITLGLDSQSSGDVNICGGGSFRNLSLYQYNAVNPTLDPITNTLTITFFLPHNGVTIKEPTYGTPFTLAPGSFRLRAYTLNSGFNAVLMDNKAVTLGTAAPCFKEDTKLLTDKGYFPIQELRKGDLVKTSLDSYLPIYKIVKGKIHHPALEERIRDQLYKYSKNNHPELIEDLIITGGHSVLVDDFHSEEEKQKTKNLFDGNIYKINNKYRLLACADLNADVFDNPGKHNIYHLALENEDKNYQYGIYANGLLVETCSIDFLNKIKDMDVIEN